MLDPAKEFCPLFRLRQCHLVSEVRAYIAVNEHNLPLVERRLQPGLGLEPAACVQHRGEMRVHALQRPEISVQDFFHPGPKPRFVLGESSELNYAAHCCDGALTKSGLRGSSAPVDSF